MARKSALIDGRTVKTFKDGTKVVQYSPADSYHVYGPGLSEGEEFYWAVVTPNYGTTLLAPGEMLSKRQGHHLDIPQDDTALAIAVAWVQGESKRIKADRAKLAEANRIAALVGEPELEVR